MFTKGLKREGSGTGYKQNQNNYIHVHVMFVGA